MQSGCESKNEPILNVYNAIKIAGHYCVILPLKLNFTFKINVVTKLSCCSHTQKCECHLKLFIHLGNSFYPHLVSCNYPLPLSSRSYFFLAGMFYLLRKTTARLLLPIKCGLDLAEGHHPRRVKSWNQRVSASAQPLQC